jgi:hypothetical protein
MPLAPARSGLVRMNDFEAQATWSSDEPESLVVRFNSEALTPYRQSQLAHYRSVTCPVTLNLPSQGRVRQATIVGFDVKDNAFYLTWLAK